MYAAREGSIDAVRALADAKADLNLGDPDGTTPLILAIVNAKFDTAVAMLDKGANPNAVDNMGMSALYAATDMHTLSPMMGRPAPPMRDSIDAVALAKTLLQKGANPNLQLKKPIIGRHTAFQGDGQLGEGTTPLARARRAEPRGVRASNSSTTRGRPPAMSLPATPPVWKVRMVNCVPGSPID